MCGLRTTVEHYAPRGRQLHGPGAVNSEPTIILLHPCRSASIKERQIRPTRDQRGRVRRAVNEMVPAAAHIRDLFDQSRTLGNPYKRVCITAWMFATFIKVHSVPEASAAWLPLRVLPLPAAGAKDQQAALRGTLSAGDLLGQGRAGSDFPGQPDHAATGAGNRQPLYHPHRRHLYQAPSWPQR